jgi:diguanylate cyclase (GGDEF)-like protein
MRNLFTKKVTEGRVASAESYQSLPLDSIEVRDLTRSSVLYLSAFITAGGFLNITRRGEPHIEMWLSLILATLTLFFVWQVRSTSRQMIASLHLLMSIMVFNISVQVVHGIHYQLMCVLPFYLIWIGLLPTLAVAAGAFAVTALTVLLASENPLIPENVMLAVSSGIVVHFAKEQVRRQTQLASSDVLTGALNRRYLLTQLSARRAEFLRTNRISSLVLIDVDGLKAINDNFGHRAGDDALKSFAEITRQRVRGSDLLFRIGGDEFALILADAKPHDALKVSNDIRHLLREHLSDDKAHFSVSFGVCAVDESSSPDDWLERADEALYEAKKGGGDIARMAA